MILSPSPSLQPTLERLSELAKLPPDWDADGSPPPSSIAIAEACRLLVAVYEAAAPTAAQSVLPFHLAPVPGGGVLLEWRGANEEIEVDVGVDGGIGYLLSRGGKPPFDERDSVPWADAVQRIGGVVAPRRR